MKDGDLWEMFANAMEARGPGCTRNTKVKGHATQELVDEGKVQKEQTKGNDQADIGAERGAVTMQRVTQMLANIYSWRHGGYRNLMVRIQRFIVSLRNHDRTIREEAKKQVDPFGKGGESLHTNKIGICRPGGREKYLNTTALRQMWFDTKARDTEATKIHSFLGNVKWRAEEGEEIGGITWLELYLLYSRHGGNKDEEEERRTDPLKNPGQMRKQLAEFKHRMRTIPRHAVNEGDEWRLQTDNCKKAEVANPSSRWKSTGH